MHITNRLEHCSCGREKQQVPHVLLLLHLHQASIMKVRYHGNGNPEMMHAHHIAMLQKTPEGGRDLCFAGLADKSAQ